VGRLDSLTVSGLPLFGLSGGSKSVGCPKCRGLPKYSKWKQNMGLLSVRYRIAYYRG
jgi:hypothetical protein